MCVSSDCAYTQQSSARIVAAAPECAKVCVCKWAKEELDASKCKNTKEREEIKQIIETENREEKKRDEEKNSVEQPNNDLP